jgi:hypothetical protein
MTRLGIADVEVHIHHDGGGEAEFVDRMTTFLTRLRRDHGLLREQGGRTRFGFIHGNWALDNSSPDGRWCGLNNEITLLRDLGCYADFTMPAAPSLCQGGPVNAVFSVVDDPSRPRSFDQGRAWGAATSPPGDLLLIPGPLTLDREGRARHRPRLDTGELGQQYPPSESRVERWLTQAPRIGEHTFLKLFAHGAQERHSEALLGDHLDRLFAACTALSRRHGFALHFGRAFDLAAQVETVGAARSGPEEARRAGLG